MATGNLPECEVCGWKLEKEGDLCEDCMGVSEREVERRRWQEPTFVVCPTHGITEATGRSVKPGKKWFSPCRPCWDATKTYVQVENFRVRCLVRPETFYDDVVDRYSNWKGAGGKLLPRIDEALAKAARGVV